MKIIAFHIGGSYAEEAALFLASMRASGVPEKDIYIKEYDPIVLPDSDLWDHATAIKPHFIQECLREFGEPVVYIDVDAIVYDNPLPALNRLVVDPRYDFAAHWFQGPSGGYDRTRNDDRFLSGTMVFNQTPASHLLVSRWIERNLLKQKDGDFTGGGQRNLFEIIQETPSKDMRIKRLPGRFCRVWDKNWAYPPGEPTIIEHTIASRENRGVSAGKVNYKRQAYLKTLRRVFLKHKK